MKIALITGITGQDGSYMADLLLSKGYIVHGVIRPTSNGSTRNIDHILSRMTIHTADMCDPVSVMRILNHNIYDEIYNFADQDHVGRSFDTVGLSTDITAGAPARLMEMVRQTHVNSYLSKIFQPASATMFGPGRYPQVEKSVLNPQSPYAVAKTAAYHSARFYRQTYGMYVSTCIFYNHDSPRRGPGYLLQRVCDDAIRIADGTLKVMRLGHNDILGHNDLDDICIDVGDAREYVKAAWLSLQQPMPDDYVIGTGEPVSLRRIACLAMLHVNIPGSHWALSIIPEEISDKRLGVKPILIADPSKAYRNMGWKALSPLSDLIRDIIQEKRARGSK